MIDAALRRQRIAVVVALAVGMGVVPLQVWATRLDGPLGLLGVLPFVLFIGLVLWNLRWQPSTGALRVDEGARVFFAPPATRTGLPPVLLGAIAYHVADSLLRPLDDPLRWPFLAVAGVVAVVIGRSLWRRVPGVELTPDGIAHRRPEKQSFVPWTALDPAAPVGFPREAGILALPVVRPELVTSSGLGRRPATVVVRDVDTAPTEIAAAVRYYLAHPEHRAAIGTQAEYARLRALPGSDG